MQMRYLGKSSNEIGAALDLTASTARGLFCKGGRLQDEYAEYSQRMVANREEQIKNLLLDRLRQEAPEALERMIDLGKTADSEGGRFKSNEWILGTMGLSASVSLESIMRGMSYERAKDTINQLAYSIYGKPFTEDVTISVTALKGHESASQINVKP